MTQPLSDGDGRAAAKERATQLLYDHIIALPHEEYGVINMLPFAHDSEQVRIVRRHVCEAIVGLFETHGMLNLATPEKPDVLITNVDVLCRRSRDLIVSLAVTEGVALVNPQHFLQTMANTNPQCPHGPITLEDMRRDMQARLDAEIAEEQARLNAEAAEESKEGVVNE